MCVYVRGGLSAPAAELRWHRQEKESSVWIGGGAKLRSSFKPQTSLTLLTGSLPLQPQLQLRLRLEGLEHRRYKAQQNTF